MYNCTKVQQIYSSDLHQAQAMKTSRMSKIVDWFVDEDREMGFWNNNPFYNGILERTCADGRTIKFSH